MTFAVIIELPLPIKQEISRLCLGLPSAEWHTEENFYISLRIFEKLNDTERWDIMDRLGEIEAKPFSLKIHGLHFSLKRGCTGVFLAALEPSSALDVLKKNIDRELHAFKQHDRENNLSAYQSIRLGTVQKESPERMASYLEANGEFESSSFEVHEYVWAQIHQTPKRSFYTVEKRYRLV